MHDISLKLAYSEVEKIGIDAKKTVGKADLQNIKMFNLFGWFCTFVGYTSGALFLNPISVYLVSLGNYIHWMKAHYVLHGAYDNIPSVPTQFNSKNFAKGIRRYIDWLDWIVPEHWRHEHNSLHHYNTSQREDPDNIERLFKDIRRANIPVIFKYFITFAIALTWKLSYYAPSTYLYYLKKKTEEELNGDIDNGELRGPRLTSPQEDPLRRPKQINYKLFLFFKLNLDYQRIVKT